MALVALIIALLSLAWSIAWRVRQHRTATPARLLVSLGFAIAPTFEDGNVRAFALTIANPGSMTTTVGPVRFDVKDIPEHIVLLDWFIRTPEPVPAVLAPGAEWRGLISDAVLRGAIAEAANDAEPWHVRAAVGDASGMTHHSDWLDVEARPTRPATKSRPRSPDLVEIPSRLATTSLPWASRQRLLEQIRGQESMTDVVQTFEAARTSRPVRLTDEQKRRLLHAIENWSLLAGGHNALPEGIDALGAALEDDVRGERRT